MAIALEAKTAAGFLSLEVSNRACAHSSGKEVCESVFHGDNLTICAAGCGIQLRQGSLLHVGEEGPREGAVRRGRWG